MPKNTLQAPGEGLAGSYNADAYIVAVQGTFMFAFTLYLY